MSVKTKIFTALSSLNVPTFGNTVPTGEKIPKDYITYIKINSSPSIEAADQEIETEHFYQVNLWTRTDPEQLANQVRNVLEFAGFERTNEHEQPKQPGDSHFNYVLRFVYYEEY